VAARRNSITILEEPVGSRGGKSEAAGQLGAGGGVQPTQSRRASKNAQQVSAVPLGDCPLLSLRTSTILSLSLSLLYHPR
jgi:hypothetical protein